MYLSLLLSVWFGRVLVSLNEHVNIEFASHLRRCHDGGRTYAALRVSFVPHEVVHIVHRPAPVGWLGYD